MYLAETKSKQIQAPFYIDVFENIINGEIEQKDEIDKAINDAVLISNKQKEIYSIDKDHYFLITFLLIYYDKNLSEISTPITNDVYSEIVKLLKDSYSNDC